MALQTISLDDHSKLSIAHFRKYEDQSIGSLVTTLCLSIAFSIIKSKDFSKKRLLTLLVSIGVILVGITEEGKTNLES